MSTEGPTINAHDVHADDTDVVNLGEPTSGVQEGVEHADELSPTQSPNEQALPGPTEGAGALRTTFE